jgi:hypothetical protein
MGDASKMSDKALKMMGFTTEQQIDAILKDPKGALPPKSWKVFWDVLKAKRKSGVMMVVSRLTEAFLKGDFKGKVAVQSVLNTIHFFCLWFQIEKTPEMKKLLAQWEKTQDLAASKTSSVYGADATLRLINVKCDAKEDLLELYVSWLHRLMSVDRINLLNGVETLDGVHLPDGVHSSLYGYVNLMCHDRKLLEKTLGLVCNQLSRIQLNRENSLETQNSVLALMHVLRSFLSYWKVSNVGLLEEAMSVCNRFFFWPSPFSKVTKRLLLKIKNEILAPSNSILERFASESRVPELLSYLEDHPNSLQK